MNTEPTKALWAKCTECGHCWPAAHYPCGLSEMGKALKKAKCPKGCAPGPRGPLVAKQRDGVLQEPST